MGRQKPVAIQFPPASNQGNPTATKKLTVEKTLDLPRALPNDCAVFNDFSWDFLGAFWGQNWQSKANLVKIACTRQMRRNV
jgi:hypothetical protein